MLATLEVCFTSFYVVLSITKHTQSRSLFDILDLLVRVACRVVRTACPRLSSCNLVAGRLIEARLVAYAPQTSLQSTLDTPRGLLLFICYVRHDA